MRSLTEWRFFTVLCVRGPEFHAQLWADEGDDLPEGYEPEWRADLEPAIQWQLARSGGTCVVGHRHMQTNLRE